MIARILHMATSFMTTKFEGVITSSILMIVQDFLNRGRQALLLIFSSFVFSVLFAAGIIISILEASSQYDTKGFIFFSAMLASSVSLSVLSLIFLGFLFWPRGINTTIFTRPQPHPAPHTSFEEILTLLVNEGVQYFKDKKAESEHNSTNSASHNRQNKSKPHTQDAN